MRSRYVAYALRRVDYLLATHAPKTRPRRADIAQWAAETTFTGLQILGAEAGGPADQRGTVTFVAQYRNGGQAAAMMEHSRFERVGGAWLYVDGDHTA
ncbi:MAG: hypothetical protein KC502_12555 [Myxococcales bacterium]|nr:hypothetical protein [Myxococcales bacterium]